MKEVAKEDCKVQKFTGQQLRKREYTVHRADILAVAPWKFPDISDLSEDEEEVDRPKVQEEDFERVLEEVQVEVARDDTETVEVEDDQHEAVRA